jgi:hypothetical protein
MSNTLNTGLANLKCKMNIFQQNPLFKVPLTMMIFSQFGSVKSGQSFQMRYWEGQSLTYLVDSLVGDQFD